MGNIKKILHKSKINKPILNNRLTIELCENVHLHYRNLRLEFSPDEFLGFLKELKKIDERTIKDFPYGDDQFNCVSLSELPEDTEFDDRLQIEEQEEGHYHFHYRNLRIEISTLDEIGLQ